MDPELMESYTQAALKAVPALEAPFKLRLINNLPRENLLLVKEEPVPGQLVFASRSFRCDPSHCPDDIPAVLKGLAAVRDARLDRKSEPPLLRVFFNAAEISPEQVIDAVKEALIAAPDPLYEGPLEVRRTQEEEQ